MFKLGLKGGALDYGRLLNHYVPQYCNTVLLGPEAVVRIRCEHNYYAKYPLEPSIEDSSDDSFYCKDEDEFLQGVTATSTQMSQITENVSTVPPQLNRFDTYPTPINEVIIIDDSSSTIDESYIEDSSSSDITKDNIVNGNGNETFSTDESVVRGPRINTNKCSTCIATEKSSGASTSTAIPSLPLIIDTSSSSSEEKENADVNKLVKSLPVVVKKSYKGQNEDTRKQPKKKCHLGLKGGSRYRLGLYGGSPVVPYRKIGLYGGSKDTADPDDKKTTTTTAEADSTETTVNGDVKLKNEVKEENLDDMDIDIKDEPLDYQRDEDGNNKFEADSNINATTSNQNSNESTNTEEERTNKDATNNDPLSALASAALDHSKDIKKTELNGSQQQSKETWFTVGFIKGCSYDVHSYFVLDKDTDDLSIDNLPELSNFPRMNLEPGTAYKFRVAAINTVGRGEWSEVSAFKTCLPGFPGAPSAIKIAKSNDGAHLSWEPPSSNQGDILEYSVYLAVKAKVIFF